MAEENKSKIKKVKEFGLTSFAVDNGTSIFILTLMIVFFGIGAYESMPKEQFPEVSFPTVFVNTPYFGNSAADIENLVTRPIEKEIKSIVGLKNVKSNSLQDFSVITAEFETYVNIDDAVRKIKDAVDKAKSDLPNDLTQDPDIFDVNLSEVPIMTVNLSGKYTNDELRSFAEYLEDEIENIDEISGVEIKGSLEREVKIDVDLPRMDALQISFQDIENAVNWENMNMSAGELVNNGFRRAVRVVGEFDRAEDMERIIVKSEDQKPIYLGDIAKVSYGYKERSSIARSDANPVVSLDVIKRKGANLLSAADKINEKVAYAKDHVFPAELKVSLFNDQSVNTRTEVSNLENSIISGVILVVLVLLFFMGIRNALFVGMAIPLSMLMGIMVLNFTGTTLNMVVLFSLILALGMLVDNGIVVVENIFRFMQGGDHRKDASKHGAGEVAIPIIASTATTLAAFLPLAFWPGLMGSFMKYLPITLIIVLTSSLLVALVINPVFASRYMAVDTKATNELDRSRKVRNTSIMAAAAFLIAILAHFTGVVWLRNTALIIAVFTLINFWLLRPASFYFQENAMPWLEMKYYQFVRWGLSGFRPWAIFLGTFALLIIAIIALAIKSPRVEFFPVADPLYINAFVQLPLGRDIDETDKIMVDMEQRIEKTLEPYTSIVDAVLSQIGENTSDPNSPPEPGVTPHKARLTVSFVPSAERNGISTFEVMEKIRAAVKGYAGVDIIVDKNADGPPTGKPINIEIQGEDIDKLAILSQEVINFIEEKNIPGIEKLQADVDVGKPELIVHIDREAARRFELSTAQIASGIRTSIFGKEVSKFKDGEDEHPIMLRLNERYRNNIDAILNQRVTFRNPTNGKIVQVPISAVADIEYSSTYSSIKRKDLDRVITVYSNVLKGYNANEIVGQLKEVLPEFNWPNGFSYEFTGEQEQQEKDLAFLSTAFIVALFSIFIIIVAQFNSIVSPFIIMLTVLFSTIGVFLGYVFTGADIVIIMTGVGIISLAGVVVNNAIVLLDYTNLLIHRRREELKKESEYDLNLAEVQDAIIQAGSRRLRPVLLTAITTVLGLIPLAIGFNFNFFTLISESDPHIFIGGDNVAFWGPLAWTVIYGLTFSTFLTLVVVPVMYWLSFKGIRWSRIRFGSNE
ncbi:MAG: efflux RND transporter permease subunit [Saprospiraceae bacterium]|nr:efflux RND transporter permease subunit [Saprospiraceae bacterium]